MREKFMNIKSRLKKGAMDDAFMQIAKIVVAVGLIVVVVFAIANKVKTTSTNAQGSINTMQNSLNNAATGNFQ